MGRKGRVTRWCVLMMGKKELDTTVGGEYRGGESKVSDQYPPVRQVPTLVSRVNLLLQYIRKKLT